LVRWIACISRELPFRYYRCVYIHPNQRQLIWYGGSSKYTRNATNSKVINLISKEMELNLIIDGAMVQCKRVECSDGKEIFYLTDIIGHVDDYIC
jgi:hypothetical protein